MRQLASPDLWPILDKIADEIIAFIQKGARIVIFGDYDCDGISATAILVKILRTLPGADVRPFIPERLTEGYGMRETSVARMRRENPNVALVITVDNGIVSVDEIAKLKAEGVSVIVTDHHLPSAILPDCLIADPKAEIPDAPCPPVFRDLCGAGVAFWVANAIIKRAKELGLIDRSKSYAGQSLILAGLATVADVMPLTGQNRILVSEALRNFRFCAPIGLRELYDKASNQGVDFMSVRDFGFIIAPRINAAGRLGSGVDALNLILCSDREKAREYAINIHNCNVERKTTGERMTKAALEQIVPNAAAQVIDLPDGHQGVAGIVAARILESLVDHPVPVCVVVKGHGSARAPEGYNIKEAFEVCRSWLDHFGGHAAAGGFSLAPENIDAFRAAFVVACAQQAKQNPKATRGAVLYDVCVTPEDLTLELFSQIKSMQPFGEGNPEPLFFAHNLTLKEIRSLGIEGRHLEITFSEGTFPRAIWWGRGDLVNKLKTNKAKSFEALFTLAKSTYRDEHVELRLVDLRPML